MKWTQKEAATVIGELDACGGSPADAYGECMLTLRSIQPYTDRATSKRAAWYKALADHPERAAERIATLRGIANQQPLSK